MALTTTLAACNTNPALNGPDGSTDLPSSLDDQCRYLASFIAQLRDGVSTAGSALWMTGMMAQFATTTTPTGWLKCNGQLVSRTTYASLFAFATAAGLVSEATWSGGSYGNFSVGDGATTFRLPDLRGMWTRGLDESRGIDSGRAIGVYQADLLFNHSHALTDTGHQHTGTTGAGGAHSHTVNDPTHSHQILQDVTNTFGSGAGLSGVGNVGAGTASTQAASTGITVNATTDHTHSFLTSSASTGITVQAAGGGAEQRVKNLAFPYYVKY